MTTRRSILYISATFFALALVVSAGLRVAADSLPAQLSDQEFWKLSSDFSEPDGFFRSDNLLSNEVWMQRVIPELLSNIKTPSVYMGVGPEQNFTYITSLRPKMRQLSAVGNHHVKRYAWLSGSTVPPTRICCTSPQKMASSASP